MISKYPNTEEIKEMYGSLLLNILNKKEEAQEYLNSITNRSFSKNKVHTDKIFNITKDRCFMVVSGETETIGRVLYGNKNLFNFLIISEEFINESSLNSFLPRPYDLDHNENLLKFIENCTSTLIFRETNLFLINTERFLCECFINAEVIADGNSIVYMISIDPIFSFYKEFGIIDIHGNIFSHTKEFHIVLGCENLYVERRNIKEFLTDFIFENLKCDVFYEFLLKNCDENRVLKKVTVLISERNILSTVIFVLFASNEEIGASQ